MKLSRKPRIRSGKLKEKIELQVKAASTNSAKDPISGWSTVATLFMSKMDTTQREVIRAAGEVNLGSTNFKARWYDVKDAKPGTHRLYYPEDDQLYEIKGVARLEKDIANIACIRVVA